MTINTNYSIPSLLYDSAHPIAESFLSNPSKFGFIRI